MFLFFSSIWALSVLLPVLIQSSSNKLQFVYLTITSHLACWKTRNFSFQNEKKKETAHHYWTLFLKRISWLLLCIFSFLAEHNPSFTLFLIYSDFLPNMSFDVLMKCVLMKKRSIVLKIRIDFRASVDKTLCTMEFSILSPMDYFLPEIFQTLIFYI